MESNMLNSVLRREINRQRAVLPFCIRMVSESVAENRAEPAENDPPKGAAKKKAVPIEKNPYYLKYADKIQKAKIVQPVVLKPSEEAAAEEQVIKTKEEMERLEAKLTKSQPNYDPGPRACGTTKPKKLDDVVRVELLEKHSAEEIQEIWTKYHRTKPDSLYAAVQVACYNAIYDLATQYPLFLFPLPRTLLAGDSEDQKEGYEFYLSQFNGHSFYFTPIAVYQRYQDLAPPCLVINHYPELSNSKRIVLMNGEYDKNLLNLIEAQGLANQIKLFYDGEDLRKKMLLHAFNKDPTVFKHEELIKEFEQSLLKPATLSGAVKNSEKQ